LYLVHLGYLVSGLMVPMWSMWTMLVPRSESCRCFALCCRVASLSVESLFRCTATDHRQPLMLPTCLASTTPARRACRYWHHRQGCRIPTMSWNGWLVPFQMLHAHLLFVRQDSPAVETPIAVGLGYWSSCLEMQQSAPTVVVLANASSNQEYMPV
jgi:hypothetical protein